MGRSVKFSTVCATGAYPVSATGARADPGGDPGRWHRAADPGRSSCQVILPEDAGHGRHHQPDQSFDPEWAKTTVNGQPRCAGNRHL
ncbi:hypothetical protein LNQ52_31925 [Klebsiella pneumoniae subsp. pneumoniae]|nr:hypothetical protein [Klebsiella pneumoniae subsp. pneumoniae]